ncbi:hypothetical protein J4377_18715 [Halomonas sp. XH26]|uniref:hypothetical protein n=1 Tax=Halomonadaceae TaxID=28256 RepID=UPI000EA0D632|nr:MULTISPECIES: hypothetical protein [Halomonas]AYF33399.1 hypothetical protein CUU95_05945 [Halomonas alkaliphila]UTA79922.1 hypothetical protein J4377_18715 [Halomonas sp. XH26]
MKTQMTALAAAVTLAFGGSVYAQALIPATGGWGVDDTSSSVDNDAWGNVEDNSSAFSTMNSQRNDLNNIAAPSDSSSNSSSVTQSSPVFNGDTWSSVLQGGGVGNQATVSQQQSSFTGNPLQSYVDQFGSDNAAEVDQITSQSATADIIQTGTANKGRVQQLNSQNNSALILQAGTDNRSLINQGGPGGISAGNQATSVQVLFSNDSAIRQTGSTNVANSFQLGSGGDSTINQQRNNNTASYIDVGVNNTSEIYQFRAGNSLVPGNEADVFQFGLGNDSDVIQIGGGNEASVSQLGSSAYSNIEQNGNDNDALVTQSGLGGSSSDIRQMDTNNSATVNQAGLFGVNESYILQSDMGIHSAIVNQTNNFSAGNANISTVTQVGATTSNASVTQTGSGNWSSTIQY